MVYSTPKSHAWAWPRRPNEKSRLICYISFICEKNHKVWFKNLWKWLCNSGLMIFDLLAPPQGPRGRGPKNGAGACAIHVSNSHTKSGWNSKKKFLTPQTPHGTPKSDPWGMTQAAEWKSRLICFISFMCEKTHKVWFENLWNWLCNWNLMIFDLLAPPQGPRGRGQKKYAVAHPIHVSNSHSKFGWISSNGLGGDSVTDGRRRLQYPGCFFKKAWG